MSETVKQKLTNELLNRRTLRLSTKVYRIPFWTNLLVDRVSDYYMVPKSNLMRLVIEEVNSMESLEFPMELPINFFNRDSQIALSLNESDISFISKISTENKISLKKTLHSIIVSGIPIVTERLENSRGIFQRKTDRLKTVHFLVNTELYDALLYVRDETGNSISLLLKEALHSYRYRTIDPLPNWKKEKQISVRLIPQEWERLEILATASKLHVHETAASLLLTHYF